eukprot:TRINITY_DN21933_c0_g1_i1.p1 TRINITY_DN21933_c0_g1~~TRINITY_DN21933_c0_g1_i1.p1  ORF type:complete len:333 (-),score=62.47 TRINITY_DN21933_c0_g1_i1:8-1006(-)
MMLPRLASGRFNKGVETLILESHSTIEGRLMGVFGRFFRWIRGKSSPKSFTMIVMGIENAGKSTLMAGLKGENPDLVTPSVGFSPETIKLGKLTYTIYDLGGGKTFRSIWTHYFAEVQGIIFVIDSADDVNMETAAQVLKDNIEDYRLKGKAVLVLANKQDKEGSISKDQLKERLGFADDSIPLEVFSCKALRKPDEPIDPGVIQGMQWLTASVKSNFAELSDRIATQKAEQEERETKERQEKKKRIEERKAAQNAPKSAIVAFTEDGTTQNATLATTEGNRSQERTLPPLRETSSPSGEVRPLNLEELVRDESGPPQDDAREEQLINTPRG